MKFDSSKYLKMEFIKNSAELKEIFKELEKQGREPRMCNTAVPFYDIPVLCGSPQEMGDEGHGCITKNSILHNIDFDNLFLEESSKKK